MATRDDDADEFAPFPGILCGVNVGNFAGVPATTAVVPPAPGDGAVPMAPLPKALCDIAGRVAALRMIVGSVSQLDRLNAGLLGIISELHAVADACPVGGVR